MQSSIQEVAKSQLVRTFTTSSTSRGIEALGHAQECSSSTTKNGGPSSPQKLYLSGGAIVFLSTTEGTRLTVESLCYHSHEISSSSQHRAHLGPNSTHL